MAINNRQVLKARFAQSEMARALANLVDSALIRNDDGLYGEWNPNVVYKNGDVVLHKHALYVLILRRQESECWDAPKETNTFQNQLPPDDGSMRDKWFNISQPKLFYLEEGSLHDGIYFIKKEEPEKSEPEFNPFKKPEEQGKIFLHINKKGQVRLLNYAGKGMHLDVEGSVAAKDFFRKIDENTFEEVEEIENWKEVIGNLKPIKYKTKPIGLNQTPAAFQLGFDPNSFGEYMSELFHPENKNQINFQNIIPILVKSVQSLEEELKKETGIKGQLIEELKRAADEREKIMERLKWLEEKLGGGEEQDMIQGY